MISTDKFKTVIENTPLISIDFLIKNKNDQYLLGKRVNRPAKGYWFTLGGRVLKNETLAKAVKRLSKKEFNLEVTQNMLKFYGIYEHFYADSFVDNNISTHYIVLVYVLDIGCTLDLPEKEHSEYSYFSKKEILESNYVHKYVQDYFKMEKINVK